MTHYSNGLDVLDVYERKRLRMESEQKQVKEDLISIITNTPLYLKPVIKEYNKETNEMKWYRGEADRLPYKKLGVWWLFEKFSFSEWYINLAYGCDNMGETVVHEALHVRFPKLKEEPINDITDLYWKDLDVRKAAGSRVVEKLGEYNL